MDAAIVAERQEADSLAGQTQRDFPGLAISAGGRSDRTDQSDSARLGEIFRCGPLQSELLIHPRLGRKEDSAPSGQGVSAPRLRLEAVEQGMAVRHAMWRALETGPRRILNGHEEGNLRHKPRRSLRATAPVLDPT